jgi:hypothetical protein
MMFTNANDLDRKSGGSPTNAFPRTPLRLLRPSRIPHPAKLRSIQIIEVKDHHLIQALLQPGCR